MTPTVKVSIVAAAVIALAACATNKPPAAGTGSGATPGTSTAPRGEPGAPVVLSEGSEASPQTGSAAPESSPSASTTRAGGAAAGAGSAVPPAAETSDERRNAIDRRLNDSLGTFDTELRKEQERVAKERDERAASSTGTADADGEDDEEGPDGKPGSADAEGVPGAETDAKESDGKRPGDLKSDRDARKGGTSGGTNAPNGSGATEIPDGSDDDIVARRLRKAAEQETDPELKEKLWKEYIEYKKNAKNTTN
jgi:hypothetical protein